MAAVRRRVFGSRKVCASISPATFMLLIGVMERAAKARGPLLARWLDLLPSAVRMELLQQHGSFSRVERVLITVAMFMSPTRRIIRFAVLLLAASRALSQVRPVFLD